LFGFLEDNFEEGTTLLDLRMTNAGPNLSSSGDPFLFELTVYISPDNAGSRKLRGALGSAYNEVCDIISNNGPALLERFQENGFEDMTDVIQGEPPTIVPSLAPSSFPSIIPSSEPTGFPIAQPSYLPTMSPKPTTVISSHPSSQPTFTSHPTKSLHPTADVASWMVEMLKRVNFERERGKYDFSCNCT